MLALFYGSGEEKKNIALTKKVGELFEKSNSFERIVIDDTSFSESALRELAGAQGLFGERYVVTIRGVVSALEYRDAFLKTLPGLAASHNYFFVLEKDLKKEFITKFEKAKADIFAFEEKTVKKERFNVFALTDAFGARDRKKVWSLYRAALMADVDPREIHGIVFWAVKNILLVIRDGKGGAAETGLSPFVFQKTKAHAAHFTLAEMENISHELVSMYHQAQSGTILFEEGLESFFLKNA